MYVIIGERERANLVVRTARIIYYIYDRRITRFFYTRVSYSRNHERISPEKMPFVVEERGEKNVVPVRLLSRERLVCSISVACVVGNALIFTRCLAVISTANLASERTLVYSLGFAALLNEAVYTSFQSSWF